MSLYKSPSLTHPCQSRTSVVTYLPTIVSTTGSPIYMYMLAKHIATILSPIVSSHIKNSVELIKDQRIGDSALMCHHNLPTFQFLKLKYKLEEDTTLADRTNLSVDSVLYHTQLCVVTTHFTYSDSIYQQKTGAVMGINGLLFLSNFS